MTGMKDMLGDTPFPAPSRAFGGETYNAKRDYERLSTQLHAILALMGDGQWRTLKFITDRVGGSEASVSARLRDLRKLKFGGHTVDKENHGGGKWAYRVVVRE